MKKYAILAIAAFFLAATALTQTINGSSFPAIGSVYTQTLADTTGVQPGNSGTGQTWNFSSLINSGKTQVDSFLLPSATPYGGTFTASTIAVHDINTGGDYYVYYKDDGSEFQRLGNAQPDIVIYSDPANEYPYPLSYGSNTNDTYYSSYMSGTSTVHMSGTLSITADGTGTVITPDGTYSGVLRVTGQRDEHDTIFGTPTLMIHLISTYTDWFQPVLYYPVMSIVETKIYPNFGPNTYQKTVGYRAGVPTGLNDHNIAENNVSVFPNPSSSGIFMFRLNTTNGQIRNLNITDITGRVIYSASGNINEINLAGTAKGIYFYHIQTMRGESYSGKLMLE